MNPCTIPTEFTDTDGDDRWISLHKRFLSECREKDPDVIFIGDGILESLQYTEYYNQLFAPLHCLNFSIRNDEVQNTLWRVQNGEVDNVKPKIIVLHIGTNNIKNSAEEISEGILKIIETIREKHPEVWIILPTLLPRGNQPNKLREKNDKVNQLLSAKCSGSSSLSGLKKVQIVPIHNGIVLSDGTISHHDMFDYLHLTNAGAKKVFEPILDLLSQILTENEPEKELVLTPSE